MHLEDQENTSFMTARGIYYYKVISFDLKNIGSIYQRLVNEMFADLISRIMEVYIDNIIMKSKNIEDHISHIR